MLAMSCGKGQDYAAMYLKLDAAFGDSGAPADATTSDIITSL